MFTNHITYQFLYSFNSIKPSLTSHRSWFIKGYNNYSWFSCFYIYILIIKFFNIFHFLFYTILWAHFVPKLFKYQLIFLYILVCFFLIFNYPLRHLLLKNIFPRIFRTINWYKSTWTNCIASFYNWIFNSIFIDKITSCKSP